jgi:hypothetical protein
LAFLDFSISILTKEPSLNLKNLLLYRFLLANGIGFIIFLGLYFLGFANEVFQRDPIHFTYVLMSIFALGLYICYRRIIEIDAAQQALSSVLPMEMPEVRRKGDRMPVLNKIIFVMSEWLALLGLIGNILGMYVMLKDSGAEGAALAHQIMAGLGTAFGATLVGALSGLWLWVNYHIIDTATNLYLVDVKHKV